MWIVGRLFTPHRKFIPRNGNWLSAVGGRLSEIRSHHHELLTQPFQQNTPWYAY